MVMRLEKEVEEVIIDCQRPKVRRSRVAWGEEVGGGMNERLSTACGSHVRHTILLHVCELDVYLIC